MVRGLGDSAPLYAAKARGNRISKAMILIPAGIVVAISLFFSYRLLLKPSNQYAQDLISGDVGNLSPAVDHHPSKPGRSKQPFLELQKIIPFGRSLELIGRVEAGSRLVVNDEFIEVSGDGSFKHFTKLFPISSERVRLVLRATDLAGRTRTLTAYHDFRAGF